MSHSGEPSEVSPKNSTKSSDLSGIVKSARPFEDQKQLAGAVAITGIVRRAPSGTSLVLVMDPQPVPWSSTNARTAVEINLADIIEHEVVQELPEGDKVLRVHVRPDASLTMSKSVKASAFSQNAPTGAPQRMMKNLHEDNFAAVKVIGDRGGTIQETIWNEWLWQVDPAAFRGIGGGQVSEPHPQPWNQQGQAASPMAMPFVLAAPHMAPSMQGMQSGVQFAPTKVPWVKEVNLDNPHIWKNPMVDVFVKAVSDPIQDPTNWLVNPVNPQAGIGGQQASSPSFMPMMSMMSSVPQFGWRSWGPGKRPGSDPGKEPGWDRVQQ